MTKLLNIGPFLGQKIFYQKSNLFTHKSIWVSNTMPKFRKNFSNSNSNSKKTSGRKNGQKDLILQGSSGYGRRSNKAQHFFLGQSFHTTINRYRMFDRILNTTRVHFEYALSLSAINNRLRTNPMKWSNTLKQFVGWDKGIIIFKQKRTKVAISKCSQGRYFRKFLGNISRSSHLRSNVTRIVNNRKVSYRNTKTTYEICSKLA